MESKGRSQITQGEVCVNGNQRKQKNNDQDDDLHCRDFHGRWLDNPSNLSLQAHIQPMLQLLRLRTHTGIFSCKFNGSTGSWLIQGSVLQQQSQWGRPRRSCGFLRTTELVEVPQGPPQDIFAAWCRRLELCLYPWRGARLLPVVRRSILSVWQLPQGVA